MALHLLLDHSNSHLHLLQHRQNRRMMNGHAVSQGKTHSGTFMPQAQQASESAISSRGTSSQQKTRQVKYVPSGRPHEVEKGSGFSSGGSNSGRGLQVSEMRHLMVANASPEQQKEILGLRMAIGSGWRRIEVETDSKSAVDMLSLKGKKQRVSNVLVNSIRQVMSRLEVVTIHHVYREANMCAHLLAQEDKIIRGDIVFYHSIPS